MASAWRRSASWATRSTSSCPGARPARRAGRRLRDGAHAEHRDAARPWQVPGDDRRRGQRGARARVLGQGRQGALEGDYVTVRMPSTEMRLVHGKCLATIGVVGNEEHELVSWGKAGKARWKATT